MLNPACLIPALKSTQTEYEHKFNKLLNTPRFYIGTERRVVFFRISSVASELAM
jgi:hypothetical protein